MAPDVPWFSLPLNSPIPGLQAGYGPQSPAGSAFEPFTDPTAFFDDWNADNPAVSGHGQHTNITRYWAQDPRYVIVLPRSDLSGAVVQPGTQVIKCFQSTFTASANPPIYTWNNWITDVNATFAKFTGVSTTAIGANYGGTQVADYSVAALGTATVGPFIWSSAFGGPTGNGINEVILTDQPLSGGGGLASLLFDPQTGIIQEADILFDTNFLFAPNGLQQDTVPTEFTALAHEVGHFFGLDHTNLHPGVAGINATPFQVNPNGAVPNSLVEYGGAVPGATPFPGMVGFITHLGANISHVATPLHADDATGISKLYPVCMPTNPALGPQKLPLINTSARIIGRLATGNAVFAGNPTQGVVGVNVLAMPQGSLGTGAPVNPQHGTLSGTARLSSTDGFLFGSYLRPGNPSTFFPNQALFGGGPYFTGNSVVGASTQPIIAALFPFVSINQATGDFAIEGLAANPIDNIAGATAYDVLFEDRAALSSQLGAWFNTLAFYVGNPTTAWGTLGVAAGVLRNFADGLIVNGAAGSPMRVIPGTTIALDPVYHDQAVWNGSNPFPGTTVNTDPAGVSYRVALEDALRPLVDIQPRTGRFTTSTVSIRVQNASDLGGDFTDCDPSQTRIYINEQLVGDLVTIFTTGLLPGIGLAPGGTADDFTITVPLATLLGHPLAATPNPQCPPLAVNPLRITVTSTLTPAGAVDAATASIVDDLLVLGRNDCIF